MHVIAFQFKASPASNDHQVRPLIDDMDVLETLGEASLGLDPPEFFQQSALGLEGKLLIGRCSCGVVGCGDVRVDAAVEGQSVTWRLPGRVYCFGLDQYTSSFKRASENTTWESVGRTAERLVALIDFTRLEQWGYKFEWASTRIANGRVTLSFTNEGAQRLFDVGWNAHNADDAAGQVRRWVAEYA
jgi:hypothetical protein